MITEKDKEVLSLICDENGKLINQRATNQYLKKNNIYDYILNRYSDNTSHTSKEAIYRLTHDIEKNPICPTCGKEIKFQIRNAYYPNHCSRTCTSNDPIIKKINSENVSKSLLKHYSNPQRKKITTEKRKKSLSKTYGENNGSPFSIKHIQEKSKEKVIKKYGVDNVFRLEKFRGDSANNERERSKKDWKKLGYNVDYIDSSVIIYNGCKIHGDIILSHNDFNNRMKRRETSIICPLCNPINYNSGEEVIIINFLKTLNVDFKINDRTLIKPYELDFVLPKYKLAIELNGVYFHSDKMKPPTYHYDKTNKCKDVGYKLLHIWESDLKNKKEIVFDIIKRNLFLFDKKLNCDNLVCKLSDNKDINKFLKKNYIYGIVSYKFAYGLYDGDEIISAICLGKVNDGICNIIAFCNKIGYNIDNGLIKLINFIFSENENINRLNAEFCRDYLLCNDFHFFCNEGILFGDYFWIDSNCNLKKEPKSKFLIENETSYSYMDKLGYFKCFTSGKEKFYIKKIN